MQWDPASPKVGEKLPDLELLDEAGRPLALSSLPGRGPLVILFFGGVNDPEGLRLLADYRDSTLALFRSGVTVCAIGHAEPSALRFLRAERGLGFAMLADADATALSRLGMLGPRRPLPRRSRPHLEAARAGDEDPRRRDADSRAARRRADPCAAAREGGALLPRLPARAAPAQTRPLTRARAAPPPPARQPAAARPAPCR